MTRKNETFLGCEVLPLTLKTVARLRFVTSEFERWDPPAKAAGGAPAETAKAKTKAKAEGLALEEEGLDVDGDVAGGPVLGADDFAFDAALAVDEIGFGEAGSAVIGCDGFGVVAESGEDDAIIFEEGLVGLRVIVDGDAENDAAFGSDFGLELIEGRSFVDAGRAPGGPEI